MCVICIFARPPIVILITVIEVDERETRQIYVHEQPSVYIRLLRADTFRLVKIEVVFFPITI